MSVSMETDRSMVGKEPSVRLHDSQRVVGRSLLVLSIFELILVWSTWPIWSLQSNVPCIPLLALGSSVSRMVDQIALLVYLGSVVTIVVAALRRPASSGRVLTLACGVALLAGTGLVIISTHRIQAWHVLYLESLVVIVTCSLASISFDRQVALFRCLPAIIYVCSALSRCSASMSESMTAQVVRVLLDLTGLDLAAKSSSVVAALAWSFAAGEFLVGVGLLVDRLRRWFTGLAMLLHVLLIISLGPWGLNHHFGVLLWNCCFLCLLPAVFGTPFRKTAVLGAPFRKPTGQSQSNAGSQALANISGLAKSPTDGQGGSIRWVERVLISIAFIFPFTGLFGVADNWPGWQLYSSRPEVWGLYVRESSVGELPADLKPFVGTPRPLEDWCPVRIDRWVLEQTDAPLYPEDRYQLGLILALTQQLPEDHIQVVIDEPGGWDYWNREFRTIHGRESLEIESERFLLNARAVISETTDR